MFGFLKRKRPAFHPDGTPVGLLPGDPIDRSTFFAPGGPFDYVQTEALHAAQRQYGICSEPACDNPIYGWCNTCTTLHHWKAPKLCAAHMATHLASNPGHRVYSLAHHEVRERI